MNFLALCQAVGKEVGLAGKPAGTTNQTATSAKLVDYTRDAWLEIQHSQNDWKFHFVEVLTDLVNGVRIYPRAHFANNISVLHALRYADDSGIIDLKPWSLSVPNVLTQTGKPGRGYVRDDDQIYMDAVADSNYPVLASYKRTAQLLAADTDIPIMPEDYHSAIVFKAVQYYAQFDAAPELLAKAQNQYSIIYFDMVSRMTPKVKFAKSAF